MDYRNTKPRMIPVIGSDDLQVASIGYGVNDVSGAMASKLKAAFAAAQFGIETIIVDGRSPSRIVSALCGQPVLGTKVVRGHT
jgi:isopentenyl phosphate kinase